MRKREVTKMRGACLVAGALLAGGAGCAGDGAPATVGPGQPDLEHRAYVVSKNSDDLTVIDLNRLEIVANLKLQNPGSHMAELSADFGKAFVSSPDSNETVVVDLRALRVVDRIPVGAFPTHLTLSRDGALIAQANEYDDSISFIDPERDVEVKRLGGFYTPHFVRWAPDGDYAYVANVGAYHLTRVDKRTLEIVDHIPLDGYSGPPNATLAPDESGFADAQIDSDGILHAAHIQTSHVILYDTRTHTKLPEVTVGPRPWIVYAEHPFTNVAVRVVPNWGDMTVSMIDRRRDVHDVVDAGDHDSNGVNYTPLAPEKAFVMNRLREEITVVDTTQGVITDQIDVGGNTETASTTPDGKLIVATVSSANRVVVIDAMTNQIIKTFDNVGLYPWSVTIPLGQNYCH